MTQFSEWHKVTDDESGKQYMVPEEAMYEIISFSELGDELIGVVKSPEGRVLTMHATKVEE